MGRAHSFVRIGDLCRLQTSRSDRQRDSAKRNVDVWIDPAEGDHVIHVPRIGQPDIESLAVHDALCDGRIHVVVYFNFRSFLLPKMRQ